MVLKNFTKKVTITSSLCYLTIMYYIINPRRQSELEIDTTYILPGAYIQMNVTYKAGVIIYFVVKPGSRLRGFVKYQQLPYLLV